MGSKGEIPPPNITSLPISEMLAALGQAPSGDGVVRPESANRATIDLEPARRTSGTTLAAKEPGAWAETIRAQLRVSLKSDPGSLIRLIYDDKKHFRTASEAAVKEALNQIRSGHINSFSELFDFHANKRREIETHFQTKARSELKEARLVWQKLIKQLKKFSKKLTTERQKAGSNDNQIRDEFLNQLEAICVEMNNFVASQKTLEPSRENFRRSFNQVITIYRNINATKGLDEFLELLGFMEKQSQLSFEQFLHDERDDKTIFGIRFPELPETVAAQGSEICKKLYGLERNPIFFTTVPDQAGNSHQFYKFALDNPQMELNPEDPIDAVFFNRIKYELSTHKQEALPDDKKVMPGRYKILTGKARIDGENWVIPLSLNDTSSSYIARLNPHVDNDGVDCIKHNTEPEDQELSEKHLNNLYQELCNPEEPLSREKLLRLIARIYWWSNNAYLVPRGGSAISNMVIETLLRKNDIPSCPFIKKDNRLVDLETYSTPENEFVNRFVKGEYGRIVAA